ncbi:MAG: hypothetical protein JNK21_10910 [Rhodospirillaceae bacterium]|nr:hypothetical protein [Rhodospirillaceae bacterium]
MRFVILTAALLALSACATEDGRPGLLTNTLCGMRESACKQRCEPMQPTDAIACRRSCEDSARDKCG